MMGNGQPSMNIAAITMVHEGYNTLRRWYAHYGSLVGFRNLYVVSHGDDPMHRDLAPKANVIGIPRTGLEGFDNKRNFALNGFMRMLETYFDVVVRTDVDELLFVDPEQHNSLSECLSAYPSDVWFAVGFNVFCGPEEAPLSGEKSVSEQRNHFVVSAAYSKAYAGCNGVLIGHHGARLANRRDAPKMVMPAGLFAAHIRNAEVGSVDSHTDMSRKRVGSVQQEIKLPVELSYPLVDGEKELADVYGLMSESFGRFRKKRKGVWVVPQIKREVRFSLPKRFVGCF